MSKDWSGLSNQMTNEKSQMKNGKSCLLLLCDCLLFKLLAEGDPIVLGGRHEKYHR